jgi:hypothetical protein
MNSGAPHRPTVECTAFELTCFRRIARSVSQGRRRRPRSGAQRAQRVQRLDRASTMRLTRQTTPGFVEEPFLRSHWADSSNVRARPFQVLGNLFGV